jgi:hypothetical protein
MPVWKAERKQREIASNNPKPEALYVLAVLASLH